MNPLLWVTFDVNFTYIYLKMRMNGTGNGENGMKRISGDNFNKILQAAFVHEDPENTKKD